MKKFYPFWGLLALLLNALPVFAAAPTTPASNVTFTGVDGGAFRINCTSGNGSKRLVIMRQGSPVTAVPVNGTDYLANSTFGNGFEMAPGEYVVGTSTVTFFDVNGLQPNTTYYVAIYEYNGSSSTTEYNVTAATGNKTTLAAPTLQASAVSFSNVTGNSMKVNWVNGNGNRRLVLMKKNSPVDVNPADLFNYSGSSSFGNGTQIGSGNYVVYNSTGSVNNVNVTSLEPGTTYYVAVFEANGGTTPVFLTTGAPSASQATTDRPTLAATGVTTSSYDGRSMRISWTSGNGNHRIIVARAGTAVDAVPADGTDYVNTTTSSFDTAHEISAGQKVIYDGTGTFVDVSGLSPSTTYYYRIYEYDVAGNTPYYLTSVFGSTSAATVTNPTLQATGLSFSGITGTQMTLNWTNGNGNRRIILAKQGSPVDATPADLTSYNYSSNFGSGNQIGTGNYVVYNGTGSTQTTIVSGLTPNVTYYFAVFEANGNVNPMYLISSPATGSAVTNNRPTVQASNLIISQQDGTSMRLSWSSGNGTKRIVVVREGSAVDAVPADGTDYITSGSTASFSSAPEIVSGQKVVYDNSGTFTDITGLNPASTYYFTVFEYNGTGSTIAYMTSSYPSANGSTVSAPTVQASGITFSNITPSSMTVNWTNGNGNRRIVVAREGSAVNGAPVDLTTYNYSSQFGSGAQIGSGNYVVYNITGATHSINVTGLSLGTTYYFAIYEANGNAAPVYLSSSPATGSQTSETHPTVAASSISFSQQEGNAMRINWTPGNGTNRIIIARQGSAVDAVPSDGVDYLGSVSASFTAAPEISAGQKVIYDGTGSFMDVTGLTPGNTYYFRIYEYSGSGSTAGYLVSSFASSSNATVAAPTVQASTMSFTSVSSTSAVISWTNGNGGRRLVVLRQGNPVNVTPADLTPYSGNNYFGSGTNMGQGNYAIYNSTGSNFTINNLLPGTTYYAAVFEFNGSSAPVYLTPGLTGQVTTIGPPAVQATTAFTSNVAGTSATLHWTNGSGNRRYVLMKASSAVDAVPANNTDYFANSFFGSGAQIGTGNFVVFDGIQDFVTVTNLTPGTTYNYAVFEYNDFGATSQVLTTAPATGNFTTGVLPVVLTSFNAHAEKGRVALDWTTAQEWNNHYFEVERSSNGLDFVTAGRLEARGSQSAATTYNFSDVQPFDGNNYYRLKQVDRDGRTAYSMIVRVKFSTEKLVRKMANPVHDVLVLELYKQPVAPTRLEVYDMNGRMMRQQSLSGQQVQLNVSALPAGNYILLVRSGDQAESIRFTRQ